MKTRKVRHLRFFLLTFFSYCLFGLSVKQAHAQPQYSVIVDNFYMSLPNQFQFDIYLSRTGGENLPYVKGQFVLTFNPAILPTGGTLSMQYISGSSELPNAQQSTNCLVYTGGATGYALYVTAPLGVLPGTTIPDSPARVRVGTYRVNNTLPFNNLISLNPVWRYQTPNPFTKIWYNNNNVVAQLSNSSISYQNPNFIPCLDCSQDYAAYLVNDVQVNSNTYEFDIYILNAGISFVIYGFQVCLLFDDSIGNGGTLSSNYIEGTSVMSPAQIPGNPDVSNTIGGKRIWKLPAKKTDLGLSSAISQGGYVGRRFGRFRIHTSASSFTTSKPNLAWNFDSSYGYTTIVEVFGFIGYFTPPFNITRPSFHFNQLLSNPVLPVELVSLNALANKNFVNLNWITATELNNRGFEIERKVFSQQSTINNTEFESVGFVQGKGTSSETNNYEFSDVVSQIGVYVYRLKQIDYDGSFKYSNEITVNVTEIANDYILSQNYPNPFNPTTTISWQSPISSWQSLKVYDVLGNEAAVLVNEYKPAGIYEVKFDASNLPSGIYFYKFQAGGFTETKKMILMR